MITGGSIYLIVKEFEKSVEFYRKLLERDVTDQNKNRFGIFYIDGLCLSIMNGYFDSENPEEVIYKGKYYSQYDDMVSIAEKENCGKTVINLETEDLRNEYERIVKLGLGSDLTEIRYVNARVPYWYFSLKDLDGNTIEITGKYNEIS